MTDGQGRNLEAVKAHQDLLTSMAQRGWERFEKESENIVLADWTTVNGVDVLRKADSDFVGVPVSGRKNSRKFDIINIADGEYICQVNKSEVYNWLLRAA